MCSLELTVATQFLARSAGKSHTWSNGVAGPTSWAACRHRPFWRQWKGWLRRVVRLVQGTRGSEAEFVQKPCKSYPGRKLGSWRQHLQALPGCSGPMFHPEITTTGYIWIKSANEVHELTRSRTRENVGLLRVFRGRAGHCLCICGVNGGRCFIK